MTHAGNEFEEQEREEAADRQLIGLYLRYGVPVDSLAYSGEFERLYAEFHAGGDARSKGEVYRRLLMLRKSGRLPRLEIRSDGGHAADSQ